MRSRCWEAGDGEGGGRGPDGGSGQAVGQYCRGWTAAFLTRQVRMALPSL
ncbi:unnamed protein product [Chondrus crispus]|uniref:Uncharacterized protein n=1 Tax=Chondrus crispus TaxID=2769 RepID=R7QG81_CHOCR|nr:unnamed protein product [Chondrus crispus]CDF36788.1 unnamed protein product [Chondrus crispus]|eukprot:XP_005716607.1 unnamed protein product [Chondrus crispus]